MTLKNNLKYIFGLLAGMFLGGLAIFLFSNLVQVNVQSVKGENKNIISEIKKEKNNTEIQENIKIENSSAGEKLEEKSSVPIKMLFGGDVMLDRQTRLDISKKGAGFLTEKIKDVFQDQDIVMINLEGAVTSNSSVSNVPVSNPNHFRFTFDKEQAKQFLSLNNVNIVSAGNNHILNFGQSGEQETRNFLEENKISYIGMPSMQENNSVIKKIKGKKIAFVAYNYSAGLSLEKVIEEIENAKKKSDFTVVYAHWGSEYHLQESGHQKDVAHKFIDAGADLIIGSHPHVVQPIEIYKDKTIFYSLGNLVFDQYFSKDVRERLIVNLLFENDKISFVLVPLYTNNYGQLELMDLEQRKVFLNRIAGDSSVSEEMKEKIRKVSFSLDLK
ncbi:MAG: CapA family protein [Candidatus Moranbacteria bacterium]|nr:CapA family protein [Candidatus Moranbacteria bacterium]